jgi:tetratricopeptide (TPR) repeat protein
VLLRELLLAMQRDSHVRWSSDDQAFFVALVGAALFAVHPVAVYGVGYLVQRTTLMATLFMLIMLIAYLRWLITAKNALWIWSAVWYLLSVFSKEHAVMAPAVALLLTLLRERPSMALARRLLAPFAAYLFIALVVIFMVKGILGTAYEPYAAETMKGMADMDGQVAHGQSVLTQAHLYFKYLILWIFPNVHWMSVDMREPFATRLTAWSFALSAVAFLAYPAIAVRLVLRRGRIGLAGWILAFPWLLFATELSTVRVQEPFVLYRSYLWFPLFGALLPMALMRLNAKTLMLFSAPIACVLVTLSWNRLNTMHTSLLLWNDAARLLVRGDEPGAGRIYYNRAQALLIDDRKVEALRDMDRVVTLHPQLQPVHYARARIYFSMSRYAEALQELSRVIELGPELADAYYARAMTLRRLGRAEDAIPDIRKSCDLKSAIGCYAMAQQATRDAVPSQSTP